MPPLTVFSLVERTFADNDAGCAFGGRGAAGVAPRGVPAIFFSSDEVQLVKPPSAINESTINVKRARSGVQNRL